jgi:hypothetical protein
MAGEATNPVMLTFCGVIHTAFIKTILQYQQKSGKQNTGKKRNV